MTLTEWTKLVKELQLSVRSHNLMMRAYKIPSQWEYDHQSDPEVLKRIQLYECLQECEKAEDVLSAMDYITNRVRCLGLKSYNEIVAHLEGYIEEDRERAKLEVWHHIRDELPQAGVPLMVKAYDTSFDRMECKYPVYYCKNPYRLNWEWIWLCSEGTICTLLPDYSEVKEWAYIEDINNQNEV